VFICSIVFILLSVFIYTFAVIGLWFSARKRCFEPHCDARLPALLLFPASYGISSQLMPNSPEISHDKEHGSP